MSSRIVLLFSLTLYTCTSAGCVPANTCFDIVTGNGLSRYDSSMKFTCSSGNAKQQLYEGGGCDPAKLKSDVATIEITDGDIIKGSSSGTIVTTYLQGVGCGSLTDPSEQCQDFMVLKHRGNKDYKTTVDGAEVPQPFVDIGTNCTDFDTNGQIYSTVVAPIGCVDQFIGSKMFACDENGWSYTHYEAKGCPQGGRILTAQSEAFVVDKCGYFSEWTHCQDGTTSGCVNDGVHDFWWYWYDLDCCPVNGKTCCGAPSTGPTAVNVGCQLTPRPTANPIAPTTKTPSKSPSQKPPTRAPVTQYPTTKAPTDASGTARPTIGTPTKQPTSPGTAKPTTGAPTNIFGTAKPTSPTTAAPTSPGTARPDPQAGQPTSAPNADNVNMISSVYGIMFGIFVLLNMY